MKFVKIVSREYGVQYAEMSLMSLRYEAKKHLPAFVLSQFYAPDDKNESCYADKREWRNFTEALNKKYSNKSNLKKFIKLFHQYGKRYVAVSKKIGGFKMAKISNEYLAKNYKKYQNSLLDYSAYVWMSFLLNNIYAEKVNKILNEKKISNSEKVVASLFSPIKRSGILKLQSRVYVLKEEKQIIPKKDINNLLKEYSWISCLDIHNDSWNKSDLDQFIKNLKSVPKIYPFNKAVSLAGLSKKEIGHFEMVRKLAYIKDMRDEYRRKGIYNILSFFSEIAKKLGITRKELAYFSSEEILEALEKIIKLSKAEAVKRQSGFLIYYDKNIFVTSDSEAIKKFIFGKIENKYFAGDQIKGIVASRGCAKGAVKIILSVKDLLKVKKGDIMVAITTHPDFVSAMHKAQAIVTDEGGLTSHAAIVSRELGIPCIVGAKIATKVLKDGDLVEVDAEKGIIKILKKN